MKKLVVVVIGVFLSFSAYSQDSKRESVEELLRVTNMESMIDGMYGQMNQVFQGMGAQLGVKPDEQPIFDAYMKKVFSAMTETMNWEKLKEPMIDIYLKHYTEKEVQDMLTFYHSETGRSMVEKMPVVMADSMKISQGMMTSFLPKVQSMAHELRTELENHRNKK
ncbi:hypothetical protein OLMES_2658 [Oleiphilus messinensis]|uniref:DUF2059 domain-containing protein n=1 Tax=Oleiphilus messinensis TaxID=141451 RepID=A0A1Y0I887_9GAMM|nr:DUF2059 domain-containing protein [Oleiphilus messinensis]ARU56708.1 hypothetical protein OLMES_2658 [Oleiphilus messinensis]